MMDYDKLIAPAAAGMRPSRIRKFFALAAELPGLKVIHRENGGLAACLGN